MRIAQGSCLLSARAEFEMWYFVNKAATQTTTLPRLRNEWQENEPWDVERYFKHRHRLPGRMRSTDSDAEEKDIALPRPTLRRPLAS